MSVPSHDATAAPSTTEPVSLVALLGASRAAIVERLRDVEHATVAELADHLEVSEVATRRHLAILEDEGFLDARSVNRGRGRPVTRYQLSSRARSLFPQRYAAVAAELMEFIGSEHGREGLRDYLRWRLDRETERLADAVTAGEVPERLTQLAEALSEQGYEAEVTEHGEGFVLKQRNCAIYDVAHDHPEMCAYEAATFAKVLGDEVSISRRQTLASGSTACVCTVTPRRSAQTAQTPRPPAHPDRESVPTDTRSTP